MKAPSDGFVQVFGDSPLDMHNVSENEYLQIINTATRYVWITTPYLILDNEMITALILAAQSGVDVRIITPHFPDKKTVFIVTQANYRRLVLGGVKIFEYTPGFIHSKAFVSDDKVAVVGTTNMDYRSFYLHFECSVVLYQTSTVVEVRDDIERTLEVCQAITEQDLADTPWIKKKAQQIISLFAPML
jgi:cardiolipin synthase